MENVNLLSFMQLAKNMAYECAGGGSDGCDSSKKQLLCRHHRYINEKNAMKTNDRKLHVNVKWR